MIPCRTEKSTARGTLARSISRSTLRDEPCLLTLRECRPPADLPEPRRFRRLGAGLQGIGSDGTTTVKFDVETAAPFPGHCDAVLAQLNQWLETSG